MKLNEKAEVVAGAGTVQKARWLQQQLDGGTGSPTVPAGHVRRGLLCMSLVFGELGLACCKFQDSKTHYQTSWKEVRIFAELWILSF